ncbi:MAG TPA: hypothetical protein VFJ20_01070 [Gemmatimonadaceae bacterium]|nr:hypothetical protein [Gemmatimonadaceae bacterium]
MADRNGHSGAVVLAALAYVVIGVATATFAGSAATPQTRTAWRLAAWVLSLAVFLVHLGYEHVRTGNSDVRGALRTAAAVALAAFVLALVGPVRTHWTASDFGRAVILSVVVWPIATGVPAFLVSLLGGMVLRRYAHR